MKQNQNTLISKIIELSNLLDKKFDSELNFRNHCYLRIAYDNTVYDKWDNLVKKPFTKYANNEQLKHVIDLLKIYLIDKEKLLKDNENSLAFRKQAALKKSESEMTLFYAINDCL